MLFLYSIISFYTPIDLLLTRGCPFRIEYQPNKYNDDDVALLNYTDISVRFMLDGENINPESTPADMDLEDDDQIDCFLAQVGGDEFWSEWPPTWKSNVDLFFCNLGINAA